MSYIVADGVCKEFGTGDGKVAAVRHIDVSIEQGEFIALMGESGAGKSTLLSMLGGLLSPTRGTVSIEGVNIYGLTRDRLADFRREFMGFIFQSFQLVPYLNVLENVQLPLAVTHHSEAEKKELALAALDRVGLKEKAYRLPNQISGGEQERVAIARAVVNEPPILYADEPTGNLDSRNSAEVMKLLKQLNSEGETIVMVTHSRRNADYADRLIEVSDGTVRSTTPLLKSAQAVSMA
ncbi:MAG: ABC transporter ATP-binding protein [Thermodesulfobacteriota bacterium]